MNEKIDDLAMQAGVNTWKMTEVGFVSFEEHELEKFVGLIIAECAAAYEAEADKWKQLDHLQSAVRRNGSRAIKEHFGIQNIAQDK